jgi:archaellum component FlaC
VKTNKQGERIDDRMDRQKKWEGDMGRRREKGIKKGRSDEDTKTIAPH